MSARLSDQHGAYFMMPGFQGLNPQASKPRFLTPQYQFIYVNKLIKQKRLYIRDYHKHTVFVSY